MKENTILVHFNSCKRKLCSLLFLISKESLTLQLRLIVLRSVVCHGEMGLGGDGVGGGDNGGVGDCDGVVGANGGDRGWW